MRLFHHAKYPFIAKRKYAYVFSGVLLAIGLGAIAVNLLTLGTWGNYGVDFTGGTLIQVRFEGDVTAAMVRGALGESAPELTRFGEEGEFLIRTPLSGETSVAEVADRIEREIRAGLPGEPFEVVRTEAVEAKVGNELQRKALLAVLFSLGLTLVYLAVRFELRFGVAAVIATAHDILITLGFLAAFRLEIALPTVAAILTILGYSLNDTIIVFDRIRENMHKKGARKRDHLEIVNESINETLPRTTLTSGTTLLVLFTLLALGGPVIRDFTIVLILGIIFGTYSSIFVASPALIEIQKRWGMGSIVEKKARPEPATV